MNIMKVKLKIEENKILYNYDVSGPWREAFNVDGIEGWYAVVGNGIHEFFIEYNENVEAVPHSIAVIPFLCNVLPIAWLYDAEVIVDELDLDFYNSIEKFKKGYIDMYPTLQFKGKLTFGKLVKNRHSIFTNLSYPLKRNKAIVLFSGGVDANFTLLNKLDEKPFLVTLWGSDLFFKNTDEWEMVSSQNKETADRLKLPYSSIKTSFRLFINYKVLDERFVKVSGASSWWHGFQHGIGIISHTAPLAWMYRIKRVYISSSYSYKDGDIKCASYPTIDNELRFCGSEVIHYDFNVTRQEKVESICRIANERGLKVNLRVCWQHAKGTNCCRCEKCVRTILAIQAEGYDPNDFGFRCDEQVYETIAQLIEEKKIIPTIYYKEIVEKLKFVKRWTDFPHVQALFKAYAK